MTPTPAQKAHARRVFRGLTKLYPDAHCALNHRTPLELLIATILSAQCTDARVNMVTPALFARYPDAKAYAEANPRELEKHIQSTGFFRAKAKNIQACCRTLVEERGGEVPGDLESLVKLPGVGRKTANVVLGDCFGVPGVTVDTHVNRLSRRLGLTTHTDPAKIEQDIMQLLPPKDWVMFNHRMITHGRQVCFARKPDCEHCGLNKICPKIGVELKRK
ncbi:MAG TPA: endonuclease III [Gemmataceae bacterium]|nr:endonuclease III [Gemmataceae bacterium]